MGGKKRGKGRERGGEFPNLFNSTLTNYPPLSETWLPH